MAADIRAHQERKLKAIQMALSEKSAQENERQHMAKYRMVRFFETKKALRHLKQLKKQPKELVSNAALEAAAMDLNYVYYFPKTLKYISLFPSVPTTASANNEEQKAQIRSKIAAQVLAGELEDAYNVFARKSRSEAQLVPQDKQGGGDTEDDEDEDDEEQEQEGQDDDDEEGEEDDQGEEDDEDFEEEEEEEDQEGQEDEDDEEDQDDEDEPDETDDDDDDEDEDEDDEDDEVDEDDEDEEEEEEEESEDEAADKKKRQKR